jgi:hypothetical protein
VKDDKKRSRLIGRTDDCWDCREYEVSNLAVLKRMPEVLILNKAKTGLLTALYIDIWMAGLSDLSFKHIPGTVQNADIHGVRSTWCLTAKTFSPWIIIRFPVSSKVHVHGLWGVFGPTLNVH